MKSLNEIMQTRYMEGVDVFGYYILCLLLTLTHKLSRHGAAHNVIDINIAIGQKIVIAERVKM